MKIGEFHYVYLVQWKKDCLNKMAHHVVSWISTPPSVRDLEGIHERVGAVSDKFPVQPIVGILVSAKVSKKRLRQAAAWLNAYNPCPYSSYVVQQSPAKTHRGHSYRSKSRNGPAYNRATRRHKRKYKAVEITRQESR